MHNLSSCQLESYGEKSKAEEETEAHGDKQNVPRRRASSVASSVANEQNDKDKGACSCWLVRAVP